jgi:hypothetical protein
VGGNLLATAVAWVFLPAAVFWTAVTPVHGKLVVSGPLSVGPRCGYLTVDPVSGRSSLARRACVRDGVRVGKEPPHSPWTPVYVGRRLAFRYQDSSTGRPVSARFGDTLWLYDVDTDRGPLLQRWSLGTGRLVREIHFPVQLWRPIMAANASGAWLMAATNGGESDSPSTATLFHASASRITAVARGPRAAMWMTAHGRTLWLETVTGLHTFRLWRYDGVRGRLLSAHAPPYLWSTTYGDGALWGASARYCGKRVAALRIDARTGVSTTVANLPLLDCDFGGAGTYYRGSFWFIDGNKLFRAR